MLCKVQVRLDQGHESARINYYRSPTQKNERKLREARKAAEEHNQEHISNMLSLDCGPVDTNVPVQISNAEVIRRALYPGS